MLGLMYLAAAGLYLAFMVFVVRKVWRFARAKGSSRVVAVALAFVAFLVVYNLAFWNLIPTIVLHRQACARDGGFQEFVDTKEWIESHRRQIEDRRGIDPDETSPSKRTPEGYSRYTYMAGLLAKEDRWVGSEAFGMTLGRLEMRVLDAETNQVLARAVNYSIGSREDVRIWLTRRSCFSGDAHPLTRLSTFNQQLKGALK